MWYVVDYLYTRAATYLEPRGFNIEHCYLIELGELTPKSPDYIAGHTSQQTHDDIAELLERLRRRPEKRSAFRRIHILTTEAIQALK